MQEVVPGGPADRAGLRAGSDERRFQARDIIVGGDVITAVNGEKLPDENALGVALLAYKPGDVVTLRVYRAGKARNVRVRLGSRPQQTGDTGPELP